MRCSSTASRALVLGDGDFAFSARLAGSGKFIVTATTVEAEAVLEQRYTATFPKHRAAVLQHSGCCFFEIDATCLDSPAPPYTQLRSSFDRVIWNNPYAEAAAPKSHRALNAKKIHKKLVADFLRCAPAVLRPGGTLVLSIDPASVILGADFLLASAAATGFELVKEYPFDAKQEHEYVLRYGDDRDLAKSRRTYTKKRIRTYEFKRKSVHCAEATPSLVLSSVNDGPKVLNVGHHEGLTSKGMFVTVLIVVSALMIVLVTLFPPKPKYH